jgi:hypothetical protein
MKLAKKVPLLICIAVFIMTMSFHLMAYNLDIKGRTTFLKQRLGNKANYLEISWELDSYREYVYRSVFDLNKDLYKDEELIKEIDEFGTYADHKITLNKNKNKKIDEFAAFLEDNGLKIGAGMGEIYIYFDPIYICKKLRDVLPSNIAEFFAVESWDIDEWFEEDEALLIPWDCIRGKIIKYEACYNKIKDFNCPYIKYKCSDYINVYLSAYMKGLGNSPISYWISEARSSFERFLDENKTSRFFVMIQKYYNDLKRNDFKFGRKTGTINGYEYNDGETIIDENNKEVFLEDIVDKYLNSIIF